MKIRNRITFILSLTVFLAVAALGVMVYVFTARFHAKEFFNRLEERVALTEQIFLENDETVTEAVRERFLQRLDDEKEYAISLKESGIDSLRQLFPRKFAADILLRETARFWDGERQGVGRHYNLPIGEYAVIVTAVDTFGQRKLAFLQKMLLIGGLACVLLLLAVSRFTLIRVLQPLENKIHRASQISGAQLGLRLVVNNPKDEIGRLAIAFNRMLDRLQAAFEAQRHFVNNASHEMRNPLTAIIGEAEVFLAKERSPEEYREALRIIQSEAEKLEQLNRQLFDLAKAEALSTVPDPRDFPLDQLVLETLEKFPAHRLELKLSPSANDCPFHGNPNLLRIAMSNLLDNALKYSGDKPVTISFFENEKKYHLTITDRGIGIPSEELGKIYQPLYRARNARSCQGHGIGLALAKKIVELHGGVLSVNSKVDEGTEVQVELVRSGS